MNESKNTYISTVSLYVDAPEHDTRDDKLRMIQEFAESIGCSVILPDEPSEDWE